MRATLSAIISLVLVAAVAVGVGGLRANASFRPGYQEQMVFGHCLVRSYPRETRAVVREFLTNAEITQRYPKIFKTNCLTTDLSRRDASFVEGGLPYLLADVVNQQDFLRRPLADISKVPPLVHRVVPQPFLSDPETIKRDNARNAVLRLVFALDKYGECVVRKSPEGVAQLLRTDSRTDDETAAFGTLSEALNACLATGSFHFSRAFLRGALSVNFFRLMEAASLSAAQTAKAPD